MNELNKEQKEKLVEALKKIKPELSDEEINAKIEAKLKNKPTALSDQELSDEELNKVNGGGLLDILANTFGDALETIFDAFVDAHTSHDEVTGPKVNMQTCSICHLPIPSGQIKDHLLNAHKDEIAEFIKNSPIF